MFENKSDWLIVQCSFDVQRDSEFGDKGVEVEKRGKDFEVVDVFFGERQGCTKKMTMDNQLRFLC